MYVNSLNLRRTVLNWPQMTSAIALSVVLAMFGYNSEELQKATETNLVNNYFHS